MTRLILIGPVYPYRGGISHFTSQMADKLLAEGYDLKVISFYQQYPDWLFPGISDKDTSTGRLKIEASFLLSPLNPISWYRTIKATYKFDPALIIFPWWVTLWTPCFLFLLIGLKNFRRIFIIHNVLPHESWFLDRWLTKLVLSKADDWILLSQSEKKKLLKLIPRIGNISVCPHPIYSVFPRLELSQQQALHTLGLQNFGNPVIMFFGIIRAYKGLADLIQAISLLRASGCEVSLLVAGEFWEEKKTYFDLVEKLGIKSHVHFTNRYVPDNEVSILFAASDLFVAPYRSGTQSGAVKTALGFGKPMILTDVIADPFVQELPELCEIVPSCRPDLLAKAIKRKLNQPPLDQNFVQELSDKSWQALTDEIRDILNRTR